MLPTTDEIQLKFFVDNNQLEDAENMINIMGIGALNNLYPDDKSATFHFYCLLHTAIKNNNIKAVTFLKKQGASSLIFYEIHSEFNGHSGAFMNIKKLDLLEWCYMCETSDEILAFIKEWRTNEFYNKS